MTRSILSLNPVSSRFERADRSHARRSQATHGPTRARGPRYNEATRAVLSPPPRQRGLKVPATSTPPGQVAADALPVPLAAAPLEPSPPRDPGAAPPSSGAPLSS